MICPADRSPSHAETKPASSVLQQVGAAQAGTLAQQDDAGVLCSGALVPLLGHVPGHEQVRGRQIVGGQPVGALHGGAEVRADGLLDPVGDFLEARQHWGAGGEPPQPDHPEADGLDMA